MAEIYTDFYICALQMTADSKFLNHRLFGFYTLILKKDMHVRILQLISQFLLYEYFSLEQSFIFKFLKIVIECEEILSLRFYSN